MNKLDKADDESKQLHQRYLKSIEDIARDVNTVAPIFDLHVHHLAEAIQSVDTGFREGCSEIADAIRYLADAQQQHLHKKTTHESAA